MTTSEKMKNYYNIKLMSFNMIIIESLLILKEYDCTYHIIIRPINYIVIRFLQPNAIKRNVKK